MSNDISEISSQIGVKLNLIEEYIAEQVCNHAQGPKNPLNQVASSRRNMSSQHFNSAVSSKLHQESH